MSAVPQEIPGRPNARGVTYGQEEIAAVQQKQIALIDQMILWQMANPGKPWTLCAQIMQVSVQWCRMVASTDAYKARYAKMSDQALKEIGMFGIRERLDAALEVGLERMADKIATSESLGDITDATEVLLKGHFGPQGGQGQGPAPTHIHVHQDVILQGKQQLLSRPAEIEVPHEEPPKV